MNNDEYLVARIGRLYFGIYCRDVKNVYTQRFRMSRLHYQSHIFRGVTHINGDLVQVIDLRRRIQMESEGEPDEVMTMISFQTDMSNMYAVVVDQIVGLKYLPKECASPHPGHLNNTHANINLLFPMIAILDDGMMIHLLDSTYLEKTEPIEEEAGDLELF